MQVHGFLGLIVILVALLSPVGAVAQPRSPSAGCDRLASVALPNTTVASAQVVPAGQFTPPGAGAKPFADLPSFCRVVGSTRMLNSDVKFEVWLPERWAGDIMPAGGNFWGGPIVFARMREVLLTGAVTVGTNLGIEGFTGPSFAKSQPEKFENLKMEPLHAVVERAKTLAALVLPQRPDLYGDERMRRRRLARCPGDGAALPERSGRGRGRELHQLRHPPWRVADVALRRDAPHARLGPAHEQAADAAPGGARSVRHERRRQGRRHREPAGVQVRSRRDRLQGRRRAELPHRGAGGRRAPHLRDAAARTHRGTALRPDGAWAASWAGRDMVGPEPYRYAMAYYRNLVFDDPQWTYQSKRPNFGADVDRGESLAGAVNAINPDLRGFVNRGGKLLLVGGWVDDLAPQNVVTYYENVIRTMGDKARDSVRLFMVPGMHHCFGGVFPGAYQVDFDPVQAVKAWKASGRAPDQIVVQTSGQGWPTRKRLVCAYPNVSDQGSGDIGDPPESFRIMQRVRLSRMSAATRPRFGRCTRGSLSALAAPSPASCGGLSRGARSRGLSPPPAAVVSACRRGVGSRALAASSPLRRSSPTRWPGAAWASRSRAVPRGPSALRRALSSPAPLGLCRARAFRCCSRPPAVRVARLWSLGGGAGPAPSVPGAPAARRGVRRVVAGARRALSWVSRGPPGLWRVRWAVAAARCRARRWALRAVSPGVGGWGRPFRGRCLRSRVLAALGGAGVFRGALSGLACASRSAAGSALCCGAWWPWSPRPGSHGRRADYRSRIHEGAPAAHRLSLMCRVLESPQRVLSVAPPRAERRPQRDALQARRRVRAESRHVRAPRMQRAADAEPRGRKRVARLLQQAAARSVGAVRGTTRAGSRRAAPDLVQREFARAAESVVGADITYVPATRGFLYLRRARC